MDVKYGCFTFDLYLLSLLNRNKYVNIDGSINIY